MKNFKKIVILSNVVIILIILFIKNNLNEKSEDVIKEDVYVEMNNYNEEVNNIILHVTGEVVNPRCYRG